MAEGYTDVTEYVNWRDGGCDLYPACLECPLERCVEDVPRGRQRRRMDGRADSMRLMRRQGRSAREIAAAFTVSVRTVQRVLQGEKAKSRTPKTGQPGNGKDNPGCKIQAINK
jgi:hypothetical protein